MILYTILGPTSSGKSELAVKLAKQFLPKKTWIVNCDSRQIYKGLNIGTGKVEGNWQKIPESQRVFFPDSKIFFYQDIPHFLLDYKDPYTDFNFSLNQFLLDFSQLFQKTEILPNYVILCGGTGFYAQSILKQTEFKIYKRGFKKSLEIYKNLLQKKSLKDLQRQWQKEIKNSSNLNQELIKINASDFGNKIRLVNRLVQILTENGQMQETQKLPRFEKKVGYFLNPEIVTLKQKIELRLQQRLKEGLEKEAENFLDLGYTKLMQLGLEYRLFWCYFYGLISKEDLYKKLLQKNLNYAKRQITWFKKQGLEEI